MIRTWFNSICILMGMTGWTQSFAPAPGQPGSTAIAADSSCFVSWATGITVNRGFLNITNPSDGLATFGEPGFALGPAQGDGTDVVSLGDSGIAVLTFDSPIMDGPGPDFAVFENGFADDYMEFAHVEVSSDGEHFFRFPSVSETPSIVQIDNFMFGDCRYVNNLAGKYRMGYGTPFDLNELTGISLLDIHSVTHVRLIDVIGSVDPAIGSMDGAGNVINDPFPTVFPSGGFDLDGVGVIHQQPLEVSEDDPLIAVYPNPASDQLIISAETMSDFQILDVTGRVIQLGKGDGSFTIDTGLWPEGYYFLHCTTRNDTFCRMIMIQH